MTIGIAEIVLLGLIADWLFRRLRIPGLVGMLLVGVLVGPYVLGWIDPDLLDLSPDLRLIALVVILLRAGFELGRQVLFRVGVRALLLAFFPAVVEGAAIVLLGPPLLGLTYLESALLGAIVAAVSPAVVVPMMIDFIQRGKGAAKGIPTMVLAAASVDDVFVIVVFSVLMGFLTGRQVGIVWKLAGIPLSIVSGIAVGIAVGLLLHRLFLRTDPRATKRVMVVIALSFLLVRLEHWVAAWIPFSALIAAMAIGFAMLEKSPPMAREIAAKLGKVWVLMEIVLFAMVGAQVNISVAWDAGPAGAALIGIGLIARGIGVLICLIGGDLDWGERLFVVVSYSPKATVQAAIGASPLLAMRMAGLPEAPGEIILAVAVSSIVLTAPVGAWATAAIGERVLRTTPGTDSVP
jgi:solute carrier family 9B (sodium/hydrogen exchanger), member 1/2